MLSLNTFRTRKHSCPWSGACRYIAKRFGFQNSAPIKIVRTRNSGNQSNFSVRYQVKALALSHPASKSRRKKESKGPRVVHWGPWTEWSGKKGGILFLDKFVRIHKCIQTKPTRGRAMLWPHHSGRLCERSITGPGYRVSNITPCLPCLLAQQSTGEMYAVFLLLLLLLCQKNI